jgi:hypothetical protein
MRPRPPHVLRVRSKLAQNRGDVVSNHLLNFDVPHGGLLNRLLNRLINRAYNRRGGVLPAATIARRIGTASSSAKPTTKKASSETRPTR